MGCILNLPPTAARALEYVESAIVQLNERLSKLEQHPEPLRDEKWQKRWKQGVYDLACLNDLIELHNLPIVRLVMHQRHQQRLDAIRANAARHN